MNLKRCLVVMSVLTIMFSCKEVHSDPTVGTDSQELRLSTDNNIDLLPTSTTGKIISHRYYTLSYQEAHEQAEWVAYQLHGKVTNKHYNRPYFEEDPLVESGSASWKNYKNSGYDKGHLCAAADMAFDFKAFEDTFYTSNISPQKHDFNDGIWNRLEQKVRYWSEKYGNIYVVTGGVLEEGLEKIGREGVSVPKYFYKILLTKKNNQYQMIAFLVPHQSSNKALYEYVVSVDEIEAKTGIDFFSKLTNTLEEKLEQSSDYKNWSF
ncbi:endonuclease [Flavobacterium branchiophilum]|uniref:Endonuclease n=2 Tax=Flavobacterium branchiophilum TaxID=55197 RepID=A0A2H3KU62_9FLAO|nr:endonuclease [Flavobacterium branchiophilum]